ncbi:GAF domain-containing sensor histidine kinase [Colwellia sp. MEBiC06753]
MQGVIQNIIQGISYSYGNAFFQRITIALDKAIDSDYTFIARLNFKQKTSTTTSLVSDGKLLDNFTYDLMHTPCENVANDSVCIYPKDVVSHFPQDQLLIDMGITGYLGTPLHDSKGQVMGLVVALYKKPIKDQEFTVSLFELFSGRIAGEFERLDHENKLIKLNNQLDQKVAQRTQALEQTVNDLKSAHQQLIESEKMAALGNLISGVAHEVNTPLGVAITATSLAMDKFTDFRKKLDGEGISINDMNSFVAQLEQSFPLIENNLIRAKELIDDFKLTAKEQADIKEAYIALNPYYRRVISTLTPLLKQKNVSFEYQCCDETIKTLPGCHAQILTNLVKNSIEHGFTSGSDNKIKLVISKAPNGGFIAHYQDNGSGIEQKMVARFIEPFVTTKRYAGATGLGLSICHNLATNALHGSFKINHSANGVDILYTFKGAA